MRIPQIPLVASFTEYGSLGSMLSVTADERLTITTQRMLQDGQYCTVVAPVARNSCMIH